MSSIMEKMMTEYAEEYAKEYAKEKIEYRDAESFIENVDILAKKFNVTTAEACTFLNKTIEDYQRAKEIVENANTEELAVEYA